MTQRPIGSDSAHDDESSTDDRRIQAEPETLRLFVALDLPDPARAALAAFRDAQDPAVWRPVPDEALHLTLAFLGHRPAGDVAAVEAVLEQADAPELELGAPLLLPPRRARVLCVAVRDVGGALGELQARVGAGLAAAGLYTPERRSFRPHATVGRLRAGARAPRATPREGPPPLAFRGEALTLYRSRLHPRGARYESLVRIALATP